MRSDHHSDSFSDFATPARMPRCEVEVLLNKIHTHHLEIQEDEDRPAREIPRSGVRVMKREGRRAVLEMTESKAIAHNLV